MRFAMAIRRTLYIAPKPPKVGSKTQNGRFSSQIALCLKKVCYSVSLCENCQHQACKTFIGLCNHAKMIVGGRPLLRENLVNTDTTPIFNLFSLVAHQP